MDTVGVFTGAVLVLGGSYLVTKSSGLAEGIENYYANIQGRQKRMYRGRFAWLTWGITPTRRVSGWLARSLSMSGIIVGLVFIIQSR